MFPEEQTSTSPDPSGKDSGGSAGFTPANDPATNGSTNADLEKMKTDLEAVRKELETAVESAKRAAADFANYRRRTEEERRRLTLFANENLIRSFLPIMEHAKLAEQHIPAEEKPKEWVVGILLIFKQMEDELKKNGLVRVAPQIGEKFNPALHEALGAGEGDKYAIIEVLSDGFLLGEKLLKAAAVRVGGG